jgi:hypothetical protein
MFVSEMIFEKIFYLNLFFVFDRNLFVIKIFSTLKIKSTDD